MRVQKACVKIPKPCQHEGTERRVAEKLTSNRTSRFRATRAECPLKWISPTTSSGSTHCPRRAPCAAEMKASTPRFKSSSSEGMTFPSASWCCRWTPDSWLNRDTAAITILLCCTGSTPAPHVGAANPHSPRILHSADPKEASERAVMSLGWHIARACAGKVAAHPGESKVDTPLPSCPIIFLLYWFCLSTVLD